MDSSTDIQRTIILIGSDDAAGTAVARSIAAHLAMPFLDLQESSQQYFDETDYDEHKLQQAWEDEGIDGVYQYMLPYDVHAIKRGVEEHSACVIRIGALQAAFDDSEMLRDLREFLQPYNVVLLQPFENENESIRLLQQHNSEIYCGKELNEYILTHQSNFVLAKQTVYTKDKTPDQTVEEVLAQVDTDEKLVLLIGAQSVGKTTVATLLSDKLGVPHISMDKLRWKYYEETNWSHEQQQQIAAEEGFVGVFRYWKQFDVHAVQRILQEHQTGVIDFGAGHSVFDNDEKLKEVTQLLSPYNNVVHLLPSADIQESIAILNARRAQTINNVELFEFLITRLSGSALAIHVVYTEGKTPDESRDAVLTKLGFA